jgi:hypothetical protein
MVLYASLDRFDRKKSHHAIAALRFFETGAPLNGKN